jgi:hypothetical protein
MRRMYIKTLREKLKQECSGKVTVRDAGLGFFYMYLTNSKDINIARKTVSEINDICKKNAKYADRVRSVDGKLYKYCISGWGAENERN